MGGLDFSHYVMPIAFWLFVNGFGALGPRWFLIFDHFCSFAPAGEKENLLALHCRLSAFFLVLLESQ